MKLLIVDDHETVRQGLKQMLTDELGEVSFGEASNSSQAIRLAIREPWDLVLLDINMPGRTGLDALEDIRKARPKLRVLILSMLPETEYAVRAIKAGAAGFVGKHAVRRELMVAVRKVLAGERYITPTLAEHLADSLARKDDRLPHETLSDREYAVMKLLADGKTVKEIGVELFLSPKTVSTYHTRLLRKLHVSNDAALVRYVLRHGLAS
ncbi:MAG: response regulator transcription factor [Verrucomicrobia bacterium]|nr:response regulator transcription factor [Verrucomicrobiota bacterium]